MPALNRAQCIKPNELLSVWANGPASSGIKGITGCHAVQSKACVMQIVEKRWKWCTMYRARVGRGGRAIADKSASSMHCCHGKAVKRPGVSVGGKRNILGRQGRCGKGAGQLAWTTMRAHERKKIHHYACSREGFGRWAACVQGSCLRWDFAVQMKRCTRLGPAALQSARRLLGKGRRGPAVEGLHNKDNGGTQTVVDIRWHLRTRGQLHVGA